MNDINTIQLAAGKGRTVWLQNLLTELLPQLSQPSTDYQAWFDSVIEVMKHRGLSQPTQQKDYLSDIRNAIRVLDPNHRALEVVDFNTSTWIQIDNQAGDKPTLKDTLKGSGLASTERPTQGGEVASPLADLGTSATQSFTASPKGLARMDGMASLRLGERKNKFIDNPDAIVKRATTLLGSYQWSEIACGLAVVTGRRCTEVIKTAQFEYKSLYSLTFTGALKRDEPVELSIEIPTLCEARLVLKAIANLRSQLGSGIRDLSIRQVSSRYSRAVATKCDRYFDEFVPPREDKDNGRLKCPNAIRASRPHLYTHLFRAVYTTIASYWYCPVV